MTDYVLTGPIKYETKYDSFTVRELRFPGTNDLARIFRLSNCCGRKCVRIKCYVDGEYDSEDDVYGDFDNMGPREAYRLAKGICCYFE